MSFLWVHQRFCVNSLLQELHLFGLWQRRLVFPASINTRPLLFPASLFIGGITDASRVAASQSSLVISGHGGRGVGWEGVVGVSSLSAFSLSRGSDLRALLICTRWSLLPADFTSRGCWALLELSRGKYAYDAHSCYVRRRDVIDGMYP